MISTTLWYNIKQQVFDISVNVYSMSYTNISLTLIQ